MDGRPVSFVVVYPWSARANAREREGGLVGMPALPMFMGLVWISLVAGTVFVRRNYGLGRLDVRGAAALAGRPLFHGNVLRDGDERGEQA